MILLIGATGTLGQAWQRFLQPTLIEYLSPTRQELSLNSQQDINKYIRNNPIYLVINCAAYTDVDAAEGPGNDEAWNVNCRAVEWLSDACAATGAKLAHYSTDYVFDGEKPTAYKTTDKPKAVNWYGHTKLVGERRVIAASKNNLVVRTANLNLEQKLVRHLKRKTGRLAVEDKYVQLTDPDWLAKRTLQLITENVTGIQHLAGKIVYLPTFAKGLAIKHWTMIATVPPNSPPRPARRPRYSILENYARKIEPEKSP